VIWSRGNSLNEIFEAAIDENAYEAVLEQSQVVFDADIDTLAVNQTEGITGLNSESLVELGNSNGVSNQFALEVLSGEKEVNKAFNSTESEEFTVLVPDASVSVN